LARYKTFDATGIAPNGRLYAGDLNGIQDFLAKAADFAQTIDVGTLRIGDSGLQISKSGTGIVSISARLAVGQWLQTQSIQILQMTEAARDALALADRGQGMVIYNIDANRLQLQNDLAGTPNWVTLALE